MINAQKVLENLKRRGNMDDKDVNGNMTLKFILNKLGVRIWIRIISVAGCF
jgi:hypothetical protein